MEKNSFRILIIVIIACFLLTIPGLAVRSTEQSVSDSLTRGGRFTVTITGLPNSSYYVWLPHTSSMTGESRDQPPVIADYQMNVAQDPADGPWPIGSFQYANGGGQTIRNDIAPSTDEMPNTNYYALVTTDHSGRATVEFLTSVNTGLRSYSVKVENPASVDSDNLMVEIQVYSRKAPSVIEISTTAETVPSTMIPVTTISTPAITAIPETTVPDTVQTTAIPPEQTPAPTQKSPVCMGITVLAACLGFVAIRRH